MKAGVYIDRLKRQCRRVLPRLVAIYAKYGYDLIITSTYEGTHSPGSLHYCDEAFDIDDPPDHLEPIMIEIKEALGPKFDVIYEKNHIHIEYDPD